MSGGHWDYENDYRLRDTLERIGQDFEMLRRFPKLAAYFRILSKHLPEISHDIDWDLSGDSSIDNDAEFEAAAIAKLRAAFDQCDRALAPTVEGES